MRVPLPSDEKSPLIFTSILLARHYDTLWLSVRQSVRNAQGEMWFSRVLFKIHRYIFSSEALWHILKFSVRNLRCTAEIFNKVPMTYDIKTSFWKRFFLMITNFSDFFMTTVNINCVCLFMVSVLCYLRMLSALFFIPKQNSKYGKECTALKPEETSLYFRQIKFLKVVCLVGVIYYFTCGTYFFNSFTALLIKIDPNIWSNPYPRYFPASL